MSARAETAGGGADATDSSMIRTKIPSRLALTYQLRGQGLTDQAQAAEREAQGLRERALAAQERLTAAQHRVEGEQPGAERQHLDGEGEVRRQAQARECEQRERDERIRRRLEQRQRREQIGLRRLRPGPGRSLYAPRMLGTGGTPPADEVEQELDREIDSIERTLDRHGATERAELARLVGARHWGPGRFSAALREVVAEGRAQRLPRRLYGPPKRD